MSLMLFKQIQAILLEKANHLNGQFLNFLPNLLAAILVLLLFLLISKILNNYFYKLAGNLVRKKDIRKFMSALLKVLFISLGILIALNILNLSTAVTSILAGAGVAGLIIGFALQDIIANYFSGVTISITNPFKPGDLVEIDGEVGVVEKIEFRSTRIVAPEGQVVEIPNKNIVNHKIINYSQTGERRVDISSGVSYDKDPALVKKVALEAIKNVDGIVKERPIEFFFEDYGDSFFKFKLRVWMNFENSQKDFFFFRSEILTSLLEAFNKNGIEMPIPASIVINK